MLQKIKSIDTLINQYDIFLFDQFGVLHDGQKIYKYVISGLEKLYRQQKQSIVISNSGKRSQDNLDRIEKIGISKSFFTDFVTSGEILYQYLKDKKKTQNIEKCYLISRGGDQSILQLLDIKVTQNLFESQYLIITGLDAPEIGFTEVKPILQEALFLKKILLCANPDKTMIIGHHLYPAAGSLAAWYEEQGGTVEWFGKPYQTIYQYACKTISKKTDRVLVIGDSMEHDIYGAKVNGFDSLLIIDGIHKEELTNENQTQNFKSLIQKYQVEPTYFMNQFQ